MIEKGSLVVFKKKLAVVKNIAEKIEICDSNNKTVKVRLKDVLFLHNGPLTSLSALRALEYDIAETRELMEDETFSFSDFYEFLCGDSSVNAAFTAFNVLHETVYFDFDQNFNVKAKSDAEIFELKKREEKKQLAAKEREELLRRIKTGNLNDADLVKMREIEMLALGESQRSSLLKDLQMEQSGEKAHEILLKTKVWDNFTNPFFRRYEINLNDHVITSADEICSGERLDLTEHLCYAIDDDGNEDPDDAISYHDNLFWVHIADAACLVSDGSELDNEAVERGANLYLPEQVFRMLPDFVTERLGLGLQDESLALSFAMSLDAESWPKLEKITLSKIKVTRTSYKNAKNDIDPLLYQQMSDFTAKFRSARIANGALELALPEVKIKVENNDIQISELVNNCSRQIVTDAMLMCGTAVAKWALENDIAMPFASQPEPDEFTHNGTMAGFYQWRRFFKPTVTSVFAEKHHGLGLDCYVRSTSPLRRYADLVAHQQIRKFLLGQALFSAAEIDEKIAKADANCGVYRKVERETNYFWKLVYLLEHQESWEGRGIIVDEFNNQYTVMIPELAFEFKKRLSGVKLNDEIKLRVNAVDLPRLQASFVVI